MVEAGGARGTRVAISLACTDCKVRNYKTTKAPTQGTIELKKFCKQCRKHTLHRETK
jgi:large subunit ribosomal protein L33